MDQHAHYAVTVQTLPSGGSHGASEYFKLEKINQKTEGNKEMKKNQK
jgi:hypothetical protein